jgi:hypothetical protein
MSSMISGTDVTFSTPRKGFDVREVLRGLHGIWPQALFQDAEEDKIHPLAAMLGKRFGDDAHEFFVYKDKAAAKSWDSHGWTEKNQNSMVHFLIDPDPDDPKSLRMTFVLGELNSEMFQLGSRIFDSLGQASSDHASSAQFPRRVDWDSEVKAVGYLAGQQNFYRDVENLQKKTYPGWTADELACHPHEALQFCQVVRRTIALVPDHLVMKALLNRRRQGRKRSA